MPDLDFDLERALAPLLERPLADPEPLPELEWRANRIRRRRWATRLGAAAGAAAIAVVAVAVLPDSADQSLRTTPPADAPPASPAAPPGPRETPPRVATIVVDGQQWFLLAGYDPSGGFCFGEATETMGTFGCGVPVPLPPGEVVTAAPAQDNRGHRPGETLPRWEPPLLSGMAAKEVGTVRVEFRSGGRAEVPVTGADAGLPVNFYMVALPPGADIEAVIALSPGGRELGRLEAPFWWETTPAPPCLPPVPDSPPCPAPAEERPGVSSVTEFRAHPPQGPG